MIYVAPLKRGTIREGVVHALRHSCAITMERVFTVLRNRGFDYAGAMAVVSKIGQCEPAVVEELLYEASQYSEVN